jgi:hypothetical protein
MRIGVAITNGMQATGARLNGLTSVAVESDGTAYLAWNQGGTSASGYVNHVLKVSPAGMLSVFAGAGPLGYSGDGGAALGARLAQPKSLAVDRQGSVYLLDYLMVRKIGSNGVITTLGGTPSGPAMGEDGPIDKAQLTDYTTVTTGPDGLLYFAEYFTSTVWKIDSQGILRRVAGNGIRGFGGDGGPARDAMLNWPEALCFDPQGNLFIFDNGNDRVRKVTPGGTISTVVGGATTDLKSDPADPVLGTQIGDSSPWGCTVDPQGNILFTDFTWNGVYRLDAAGVVKRVVGTGGVAEWLWRRRRASVLGAAFPATWPGLRQQGQPLYCRLLESPCPQGQPRRNYLHVRGDGNRRFLRGWRAGNSGPVERSLRARHRCPG